MLHTAEEHIFTLPYPVHCIRAHLQYPAHCVRAHLQYPAHCSGKYSCTLHTSLLHMFGALQAHVLYTTLRHMFSLYTGLGNIFCTPHTVNLRRVWCTTARAMYHIWCTTVLPCTMNAALQHMLFTMINTTYFFFKSRMLHYSTCSVPCVMYYNICFVCCKPGCRKHSEL